MLSLKERRTKKKEDQRKGWQETYERWSNELEELKEDLPKVNGSTTRDLIENEISKTEGFMRAFKGELLGE